MRLHQLRTLVFSLCFSSACLTAASTYTCTTFPVGDSGEEHHGQNPQGYRGVDLFPLSLTNDNRMSGVNEESDLRGDLFPFYVNSNGQDLPFQPANYDGGLIFAALNNNRQGAGWRTQGSEVPVEAFIVNLSHNPPTYQFFGPPPNPPALTFNRMSVSAINDHAQVLGTASAINPDRTSTRYWYLYDTASGIQTFDPEKVNDEYLFDNNIVPAGGLNNDGTAVLTDRLRFADGREEPLTIPGGLLDQVTRFYGINNHDEIAGNFSLLGSGVNGAKTYIAFPIVLLSDGSIQPVSCPNQGVNPLSIYGINDNGAVSGSYIHVYPYPEHGTAVRATPTGLRSNLQLSHSDWSFSAHPVGEASGTGTVYLTSNGDADLLINGVLEGASKTADAPSDFILTSNTCAAPSTAFAKSVRPGGFCALSFQFKPTAVGLRNASIVIYDDAPGSPHTIRLHGTGLGNATFNISNTSWDFGPQPVGRLTAAGRVYLYNPGPQPVHFTAATLSGKNTSDFLVMDGCGPTLPGYKTCALDLKFKATAAGYRTAELTLVNDSTKPAQVIRLAGTGR